MIAIARAGGRGDVLRKKRRKRKSGGEREDDDAENEEEEEEDDETEEMEKNGGCEAAVKRGRVRVGPSWLAGWMQTEDPKGGGGGWTDERAKRTRQRDGKGTRREKGGTG